VVQGEKIWGSRLKKRRGQKAKGSRIQGFEESEKRRIQGFEDSRIQVVLLVFFFKHKSEEVETEDRGQKTEEGWRVGGLAKNQKSEGVE